MAPITNFSKNLQGLKMFVLHLCQRMWKTSRKESTVTFSSLGQFGQQIYTEANYNLRECGFRLRQAIIHHKEVHQRLSSVYPGLFPQRSPG